MNGRKLTLAAVALAIVLASGCGKKDERVVAEFGGKKITAGALLLQYNRISAPNRPLFSTMEQKKAFLEIMVLKEILKSEAVARGLDKAPEVEAGVVQFEEQQLIKDMYNEKGQKPVTLEPAEIEEHYKKTGAKVRVRDIWVDQDRAKADEVLKSIRGGADFEAMARKHSKNEYASKGGDMGVHERSSPALALFGKSLDGMKPGDVSDVLETPAGFHIVQIVEEQPADMAEFEARKMAVRADLRRQKEAQEWQRFLQNLRTQTSPTPVAENIRLAQERQRQAGRGVVPDFSEAELALPLISYAGGSWNISDFVKYVNSVPADYRPFIADTTMDWGATWMTSRAVNRLILKSARDLGLDKTPDFIERGQRKREELMLDALHKDIVKDVTVTEEEKTAYYEAKKDSMIGPDTANLRFLVVSSRARVDSAYAELEAGKPFEAVVRKYSEDPNVETTGGRVDGLKRGSPGMHEAEAALFALEPGQWTKPVPVQQSFFILQLLEKWPGAKLTYPEVSEMIAVQIRARKEAELFDAWVAEKKKGMNIKVHDSALGAIVVEEGGEA